MAIITCDICDKHNVPGSHGQDSTGCDVTACFICQGDEIDPYCEMEEAAKVVPFQPYLEKREFQDRVEWAEQESSKLFVMATVRAHDDYNAEMMAARGCVGDAWSRRRKAAKAKFQAATKEAHDLCERTEDWFTRHAELSKELDAEWTALIEREAVASAMNEAAE